MIVNYEDKLYRNDLSYEKNEMLVGVVKSRIKDNKELMTKIKEFVEYDNRDNVEGKISNESFVELKVDEMAQNAVNMIKMYVEFDMDVSETDL